VPTDKLFTGQRLDATGSYHICIDIAVNSVWNDGRLVTMPARAGLDFTLSGASVLDIRDVSVGDAGFDVSAAMRRTMKQPLFMKYLA